MNHRSTLFALVMLAALSLLSGCTITTSSRIGNGRPVYHHSHSYPGGYYRQYSGGTTVVREVRTYRITPFGPPADAPPRYRPAPHRHGPHCRHHSRVPARPR
jgi:hypothetical protein